MTKILITGITGKSGEYMLKKMIAHANELQNYAFCVMVRPNSDTKLLDSTTLHIKKFYGDLSNYDSVAKFCSEEYDALVHIAGIQRSLPLVKIAVDSGIRRLVLVHTSGIYSKYKAVGNEYRKIEEEINQYIAGKQVSLTILRPTMVYGTLHDNNLSVFIRLVDKLRIFPIVNGGKYELQPVWCKDLGEAYYDIMVTPQLTSNKDYDLSGGQAILLIDMLKEIARQLGVHNTFVSCPFWLAYSAAWIVYILSLGRKDFREKVQRLVEPRAYSHENATRDFGYNPSAFSDGISEEIQKYKNQKSSGCKNVH